MQGGRDERYINTTRLKILTNKMAINLDVLGTLTGDRVIGNLDSTLAISY